MHCSILSLPTADSAPTRHAVFQLRYGDDVVVDYGLNYTCAGALALPIGR
jgi:hypothetical protein